MFFERDMWQQQRPLPARVIGSTLGAMNPGLVAHKSRRKDSNSRGRKQSAKANVGPLFCSEWNNPFYLSLPAEWLTAASATHQGSSVRNQGSNAQSDLSRSLGAALNFHSDLVEEKQMFRAIRLPHSADSSYWSSTLSPAPCREWNPRSPAESRPPCPA